MFASAVLPGRHHGPTAVEIPFVVAEERGMVGFRKALTGLGKFFTEFRENSSRAHRDGGVAPARQVFDMVRLRFGPGNLSPEDYYRMRVYRRILSFDEKRLFVSRDGVGIPRRWTPVADDKLLVYALLEYEGVRIPPIRAICHPLRAFRDRLALRTVGEICDYLSNGARYPFISKPVAGVFSKGLVQVEKLDSDSGLLRLAEGGPVPVERFAEKCLSPPDGTVFQEVLKPHPEIAAEISQRLCTLRLIVALERDHVRLYRAFWKIAAGSNVADNYWHEGNIIARLDPMGRIEQCTSGLGPDFRIVERHPVTGREMKGFQVPYFREAVELAQRIARYFPGIKMQAWDIGITAEGPVPIEVNDVGSVFLVQAVDQRGMYDRSFREFVARTNGRS
jgi:hypothetical protein